ncbi:TVP38/TMEM64 family protein [Halanaerobium sp. Z-7514]|uniref:TVP38/TMEM64 family membrane protein n=1 Tax=Halanaerobium polyolivorans TaxID=2886943 RepID=A0AAW4WS99_9FIRM|nr:TVP38/TMEM64 family protein [Halanaerobium polyolivorans]MCC3143968.1 TVP38/TMEM64 family protein [Halanaerobium polyolivorans]RQD78271.1 MAG: TVP38/TMEM64 family protein [Halanaerobium sp. MSAO_Bac5]
MNKHWYKFLLLIIIIAIGMFSLYYFGVADYFTLENLEQIRDQIEGYGYLGPIIYIAVFTIGTLFFLPAIPFAILGGLLFGFFWGLVWVLVATTTAVSLAFLAGRYAIHDLAEDIFKHKDYYQKIQTGFNDYGWKVILITRFLPMFPFIPQSYIYGLINIKFRTYIIFSFIGKIPASIAYVYIGSSLMHWVV